MSLKLFDTPESLFQAIPTELQANLEFRKKIHSKLEKDRNLQKLFMQMLFVEPKIFFNAVTWTLNPRKPPKERSWPFILRKPKQEELVEAIKEAINNQTNLGVNKSRDEGATEIVSKMYALYALVPESYFIVGSRNKELVDSMGDPFTLFAKIDYAYSTMPPWMQAFIQYNPSTDRKDMQLNLYAVSSVIRGETTNESFSAGRRATSIFLDEFGRVEPRVAESIEGSIHDVSGCVIYGSTHWFGTNHPFNRALLKPSTRVVNMLWYDNPVKAQGLYKSPDYDVIEIVDKDYYVKYYPDIFVEREHLFASPFRLSEVENELVAQGYVGPSPKFIADRCEGLPKGADVRSPWHDQEEEKRKGNRRDFVSNVWGSPIGSNDMVFSDIVLNRIESSTIKKAKFVGDITFNRSEDGTISESRFSLNGKPRFQWWGELKNGTPDRARGYVVGCDPSLGTGNSNSVAAVLDTETHEIVGLWVDPNTVVEVFADTVVALAQWLGEAYIIFENNGGHGVNFGRRLVKDKYHRIYTQHAEDSKLKNVQNKWGWASTPNSKSEMLGELGIALSEGLRTKPAYISCIIHDADLLDELRGYVFYENGDIGSEEIQDITSGARKRHGDRVIAAGLCILGSKYQHKKPKTEKKRPSFDSFEYRKQQVEEQMANENRFARRVRY